MKTCMVALLSLVMTGTGSAFEQPARYSPLRSGYDWSGAYIGGHVGYGWGGSTNAWYGGGFPPWQADGYIAYQSPNGGAQIGYQQQFGNIVGGVESDLSFGRYFGDDSKFASVINQIEIVATSSFRGRLGWAQDNMLFYGTVGVATASFLKNEAGGLPTTPQLALGWTAGGGMELAISNDWRLRAEYLHTRLGQVDTFLGYMHRANAPTINVLRVGASYRF